MVFKNVDCFRSTPVHLINPNVQKKILYPTTNNEQDILTLEQYKIALKVLENYLGKTNFVYYIDESTDVSSMKLLALVRINYEWNVKGYFLQLIPLHITTAQSMYDVIINFFIKYQVPYNKNLIAFAMMENKISQKTLLVKDIPNIFVMKCICHSLALCCNYACLKLPDQVEKLVRKEIFITS